jgi:hypothetical protein
MHATHPPAKLVTSPDLVRRVVATEIAYTVSRMQVLESLPGNPVGIAFRPFEEGAMALMARHLPVPFFNSVVGLRAGQARYLEPLVDWYRSNGLKGRFVLESADYAADLGRELARLGYVLSGFYAALVAEPGAAATVADGIAIEPVSDPAAFEEYLDAYVAGWGIPTRPASRPTCTAGWTSRVGRSISAAPRAGRRPPRRST